MAHTGGDNINPGFLQRIGAGMSLMVTGQVPVWFGPNDPLQPVAPPEVEGRRFDYPVGVNLQYMPRHEQSESGVTFEQLRRISDPALGGLDLCRLAIETLKDKLSAQKWSITGEDGKDGGDKAKKVTRLLRRPDGILTYSVWARQLWEDMLVIDAPCVFIERKIPEIVDGAGIKLLSDGNGRRPLAPMPSYQQVLKGMPAVDYTTDQMIYFPRNLRSNKFYGMSPVEQLINILTLALKRQLSLNAVYTAGNVPDYLLGVPETWNADQIRRAQEGLDAMLSGSIEGKRKLHLIPDVNPIRLGDPTLHEGFDEWLARIICWCFSLPPTALVRQVNRATAEVAQSASQLEGLEPIKEWWKDFMDEIISKCYGYDDMRLAWNDAEVVNPVDKATIVSIYVGKKPIMTPDEARQKYLGMDPLTPEQKAELEPPPPPTPFGGGNQGGDQLFEPKPTNPDETVTKRRLLRGDQSGQTACECGKCQDSGSEHGISYRYP